MSCVHHIQNDKELKTLLSLHPSSVLVINFYTTWSPQSQIFSTEFDRLAQKPLLQSLMLLHCHSEIHSFITRQYRVDKVPTVLFFENRKVVDKVDSFDLNILKRKLLQYATRVYQCTYHLNASPDEMRRRMNSLFSNTRIIVFVDSYHSNTTWVMYSLLDTLCAPYEVFNVSLDYAVKVFLQKCWRITTYPQLFMFGKLVGNINKVRCLKTNRFKEGNKFTRAIERINKLEHCFTDPMSVAMHRVGKVLSENQIVVFLEEDQFKPECCDTGIVLNILCVNNLRFKRFNVLQSRQIRQAIQSRSGWTSFPQVFVDGRFVGGADQFLTLSGDQRQMADLKRRCEFGKKSLSNRSCERKICNRGLKCKL